MARIRIKQGHFRQLAYLRAPVEIARIYRLTGLQRLGHAIIWDCEGDWDQVEAFFAAPRLQQRGGWSNVRMFMMERREYFDALFIETLRLYLRYRNSTIGGRGGKA